MSFSADVKNELARLTAAKHCCAVAECYGALLFAHTFSSREARFVTANRSVVKRLAALFRLAFDVEFDEIRGGDARQSLLITDETKLREIIGTFGFAPDEMLSAHLNLGALEGECCRVSLLRGAFLAGGNVADPDRTYHLEMKTRHRAAARETLSLLRELGFEPRLTERNTASMLYFKQSTAI
ncbi:MAG: DNA-binding protein WhiA, partial [Oscillospiraceae bacterium]|nr:DNA-binding protein WhiA [Oscillospiraceae bacterium]